MHRFHVHLRVTDLTQSIAFYSRLFAAELADLKDRAEAADLALLDEGQTTCCYARSDKHWITDPQGIAWEHFQTLGNVPLFGKPTPAKGAAAACC